MQELLTVAREDVLRVVNSIILKSTVDSSELASALDADSALLHNSGQPGPNSPEPDRLMLR